MVPAMKLLFSNHGLGKFPGENFHCLFHHLLKHLAGRFDFLDQTRNLPSQAAYVINFLPLDKAGQKG